MFPEFKGIIDTARNEQRPLQLLDKLSNHCSEHYEHSILIPEPVLKVAQILGIPEDEFLAMARGNLLHDIGKILIPIEILRHPYKELPEEKKMMLRKHVDYGFELTKEFLPRESIIYVLGTHLHKPNPYPDRDKLPFEFTPEEDYLTQITAACDILDAIFCNRRPYNGYLKNDMAKINAFNDEFIGDKEIKKVVLDTILPKYLSNNL